MTNELRKKKLAGPGAFGYSSGFLRRAVGTNSQDRSRKVLARISIRLHIIGDAGYFFSYGDDPTGRLTTNDRNNGNGNHTRTKAPASMVRGEYPLSIMLGRIQTGELGARLQRDLLAIFNGGSTIPANRTGARWSVPGLLCPAGRLNLIRYEKMTETESWQPSFNEVAQIRVMQHGEVWLAKVGGFSAVAATKQDAVAAAMDYLGSLSKKP